MTETLPLTDVGNAVLIDREGMRTTAYYDSVGVLTVCVGHTSAAGPPEVYPGLTMTEEECCELFATDVLQYAAAVDDVITAPMLDHERDSFASICYNVGQSGFAGATFTERFNSGDKAGCAEAILWWNSPDEIIPRREAERWQFLTPYSDSMPWARSTDDGPIDAPAPEEPDMPAKPDKPAKPEAPGTGRPVATPAITHMALTAKEPTHLRLQLNGPITIEVERLPAPKHIP